MRKFPLQSQNQPITLPEDVAVVPNHQNPKGTIGNIRVKKYILFLVGNHQKEMKNDLDRRYEILKNQPEILKNLVVNHRHPKRIK